MVFSLQIVTETGVNLFSKTEGMKEADFASVGLLQALYISGIDNNIKTELLTTKNSIIMYKDIDISDMKIILILYKNTSIPTTSNILHTYKNLINVIQNFILMFVGYKHLAQAIAKNQFDILKKYFKVKNQISLFYILY
jgi:hypothetical protein